MELEQEIIKLRNGGLKYDEISKKLNCSISTISKYCRSNGLGHYTGKIDIPDNIIIKIQERYDNGETLRDLSSEFGYGRSIISRNIKNKRHKIRQTVEERKISISKGVVSWRIRKKQELVEYKGGVCVICGYGKSLRSLQFHHVNPLEKDFSISGKSYSIERLKKEVDKCILVCGNCHCEIHDGLYSQEDVCKLHGSIYNLVDINEHCTKNQNKNQRKVERPTYDKLLDEINKFGYKGTGRKYGVSDNSIRNWKKYYEKYMGS